jgi:hypothetical protein
MPTFDEYRALPIDKSPSDEPRLRVLGASPSDLASGRIGVTAMMVRHIADAPGKDIYT